MPRLACSLDIMLARHARAFGALGGPAHASSLESALARVGRLEDAYLLRWRRGEPSLVAAALADAQRPTLAALDADPALQVVPCETCGPLGHDAVLEVATGPGPDALRWTALGAAVALPEAPVMGARGVRRPGELLAVASLGTITVLDLSSTALRPGASLPPTTESLRVHLGDADGGDLDPQHLAGLGQLYALALRGRLTDERLEALLAACEGRLEHLRVDASLLTDVGLEALTRAPRLRDLALGDAPWLDGSCLGSLVDVGAPLARFSLRNAPRSTWRTLDAVASLETVSEVELDRVALDDDGLGALAGLPRLRRLTLARGVARAGALDVLEETTVEHLELARVAGVDDPALEALASSATLRHLSASDVHDPTPRGWSALGRAPRLERLTLQRCSVDTDALVAIARSSSLVDLTLDSLTPAPSSEACRAVGEMPRLQRLSLGGSFSTPDVLDALAQARVTTLELRASWRPTTHGHLAAVARLKHLVQLLVDAPIEPGAVASLAGAPELQELALSDAAELDDAELAALRACLSLRSLRLWCDEPARLRLSDALPGVDVRCSGPGRVASAAGH